MPLPIRYDWDPAKRTQNLAKHGLDFEDAWRVYEHPARFDAESERAGTEYRRKAMALSTATDAVCVLVYVVRGDSVRCISLRRASRREREEYRGHLEEGRELHE